MKTILLLLNQHATNKAVDVFRKDDWYAFFEIEGSVKVTLTTKSFEFVHADDPHFKVTLEDNVIVKVYI